jgi:O-antigen/teichoic acid export membrane protein
LSLSQVIFPLLLFPYVARIILPVGIGEVSFVESICRYAILFSGLGIPIYGVREVAKCKNDHLKLNRLFSELIFIHFIITLFVLVVYLVLLFTVGKLNQNIEFYYIGVLMIFSNIFIVEWYFQGIGQFKFITLRNLIIRSILTILFFFLVKNKQDGIIYFSTIVLTSVLNAIVNFIYAKKTIKFDFSFNWLSLKKHFVPLFFIFSSIAFISIYTLLDTIMLGFLANEKAVGLYTTALKVSKVPMTFIGALGVVLIPQLSEHFHNSNLIEFNRLINKSVNFVITFSIPAILLLMGSSNIIIVLFAGESFSDASVVLKILSVLSLLIGISNVFGLQVLTPMAKDKYLTYSVVFGTVISLLLNFILIPIYNEVGAAISNVIAEIAVTAATIFFATKFISIKLDSVFIIKTILVSIPILIIPFLIKYVTDNPIISLVSTFCIALFYYMFMQVKVLKNDLLIEIMNVIIQKKRNERV